MINHYKKQLWKKNAFGREEKAESNGKALLIFGKERLANIKEIKVIFDFGKRLKKVV